MKYKEKLTQTKRSGKNKAKEDSYAAQRLEKPYQVEAPTNQTVFHRTEQLEYFEGGSQE